MDSVELSCPVDVVVPAKLMGSDGCNGIRVRAVEAEKNCESTRVSIERCNTPIKQKDGGNSSCAADSSLWRKLLHSHDFLHERLTKFHIGNSTEVRNSLCTNGLPTDAKPESAELQRKAGKVSRNSCGPSKRAKALPEDRVSSARDKDITDASEQGSFGSDKTQTVKQRNSFGGKRGDKKNAKAPLRTLQNFGLASGENAFFGVYGLKPEINDVMKLVDDFPLNDLLESCYEFRASGKELEKKVENANESFLSSVRKACSVLLTKRPVQSQITAEVDAYASNALDSPSSISTVANGETSDKGNACKADLSSSYKELPSKSETPSSQLNFPLCEASDVLKRLGLPPPRDLDSLLLDATKPSQYSRNNSDLRSGKQPLRRVGLPPFPWSHPFNGNCRTNSEAAKLLTSRTSCHGRWSRIGNSFSSPRSVTDGFTNLDSLTFNQNLVPFKPKQCITGNESSQTLSSSFPCCQCASSSSSFAFTADEASNVSLETGVRLNDQNDQNNASLHCPRLLAAAQTLYNIATQSPKHNPNGILRWPKKLSQKSMKARKSKSLEKTKGTHTQPTMSLDPSPNKKQGREDSAEQLKPSKRSKLSMVENKRGSPSPSGSEPNPQRRHSYANNKFKQPCILPSPKRASENPSAFQQKARKYMATD